MNQTSVSRVHAILIYSDETFVSRNGILPKLLERGVQVDRLVKEDRVRGGNFSGAELIILMENQLKEPRKVIEALPEGVPCLRITHQVSGSGWRDVEAFVDNRIRQVAATPRGGEVVRLPTRTPPPSSQAPDTDPASVRDFTELAEHYAKECDGLKLDIESMGRELAAAKDAQSAAEAALATAQTDATNLRKQGLERRREIEELKKALAAAAANRDEYAARCRKAAGEYETVTKKLSDLESKLAKRVSDDPQRQKTETRVRELEAMLAEKDREGQQATKEGLAASRHIEKLQGEMEALRTATPASAPVRVDETLVDAVFLLFEQGVSTVEDLKAHVKRVFHGK